MSQSNSFSKIFSPICQVETQLIESRLKFRLLLLIRTASCPTPSAHQSTKILWCQTIELHCLAYASMLAPFHSWLSTIIIGFIFFWPFLLKFWLKISAFAATSLTCIRKLSIFPLIFFFYFFQTVLIAACFIIIDALLLRHYDFLRSFYGWAWSMCCWDSWLLSSLIIQMKAVKVDRT